MIETAAGLFGAGVLLFGLTLASIGLYGMLRKPALFEQLHAAGLITGPGVILVLLASLATGSAEIATSSILVIAFILITSSLSTHAMALAAWRLETSATPRTGGSSRPMTSPTAMRVLLAHDGSPDAAVATSLAASVPWGAGSSIRVLTVIEGGLRPLADEPSSSPVDHPADDLGAVLDAAASSLRRPGISVELVSVRGDPATVIATEADSFGADLVLMGSRGLGPVRALLLGSVAAAVMDAAACPVLVARKRMISSVLLGVDASGTSDAAIGVMARWPIFEGVPVRVLSVATASPRYGDPAAGGTMQERIETAHQQHIADAAAMRLREAGRMAVPIVRAGDAAARILGVAQAEETDLIVLGSRGQTGVRRALLGSVARSVLSSTEASVLVVKAPPR